MISAEVLEWTFIGISNIICSNIFNILAVLSIPRLLPLRTIARTSLAGLFIDVNIYQAPCPCFRREALIAEPRSLAGPAVPRRVGDLSRIPLYNGSLLTA